MTDSKDRIDTDAMERAFGSSNAPVGKLGDLNNALAKLPDGATVKRIHNHKGTLGAAKAISHSLCTSVIETGQAFIAAQPARNIDGTTMDDPNKAQAMALESLALGMVQNIQNLMLNVQKYNGTISTFECTPDLDVLRIAVGKAVAGDVQVSDIPPVVVSVVVASEHTPDMLSVWTLVPSQLTLAVNVTTKS